MKRRAFLSSLAGVGTSLLTMRSAPGLAQERGGRFTHGVASGDPDQGGFVAWTRYLPADGGNAELWLEVAADPNFSEVLKCRNVVASACNDHCVCAQLDGLAPGRWYYYRFRSSDGGKSRVGRSRTLPAVGVERFRIAVVSCSNATSGWFNTFAHLAQRDDIDLVVHVGDYIYESPVTRSDAIPGMAETRGIRPAHEVVTLSDYRQRYASYREDADLRALHERVPFIAMMDDHESANNSWHGGAKDHQPAEEGPWHLRKYAALKAYNEWIPRRESLYGRFDIGSLASLFRLETRLLGRSAQLDLRDFDLDDEESIARLRNEVAKPSRSMLGSEQEQWLASELRASRDANIAWQVLAQGVVLSEQRYPEAAAQWVKSGVAKPRSDFWQTWLPRFVNATQAGLPHSLDKWDGYPAARRRLLDAAAGADANLLVLSGDSHASLAFDLMHEKEPLGAEFSTPSVSSFGMDKHFSGGFAKMSSDFQEANPNLKWCDLHRRGFLRVDITRERVEGKWHFVPSGAEKTQAVDGTKRLWLRRGEGRLRQS